MSDHPAFCDCDACLNGAGGYVLPGAGAARSVTRKQQREGRGFPRLCASTSVTEAGRRLEREEEAKRARLRREGKVA